MCCRNAHTQHITAVTFQSQHNVETHGIDGESRATDEMEGVVARDVGTDDIKPSTTSVQAREPPRTGGVMQRSNTSSATTEQFVA